MWLTTGHLAAFPGRDVHTVREVQHALVIFCGHGTSQYGIAAFKSQMNLAAIPRRLAARPHSAGIARSAMPARGGPLVSFPDWLVAEGHDAPRQGPYQATSRILVVMRAVGYFHVTNERRDAGEVALLASRQGGIAANLNVRAELHGRHVAGQRGIATTE